MNALVNMIARTLVRSATYSLSRRSGKVGGIVLGVVGAVVMVVTHR